MLPVQCAGVKVTAVDANHCPGAAILLFALPNGEKYVHCGDMRYCVSMKSCPHLMGFRSCDAVFLDTTYCAPKHAFPPQDVSVCEVGRLCKAYLEEDPSRCASEDVLRHIRILFASCSNDDLWLAMESSQLNGTAITRRHVLTRSDTIAPDSNLSTDHTTRAARACHGTHTKHGAGSS